MTDTRRIVSENRRAIWIIAAALIVNAALYVLVVYPLSQRVQAGEDQAAGATSALNQARRTFNAATGTVSGKKQADEELRRFYGEVLPPDQSAARRLLYPYLDQLARKANLTTVRYRLEPEPDREGGLGKLTMTLNLVGEYPNIRRFIHQLETAAEFLILERVAVTQEAEGSGRLNVTANVATYYRGGENGN
jgi:Tfp pilus assembly protein PilO